MDIITEKKTVSTITTHTFKCDGCGVVLGSQEEPLEFEIGLREWEFKGIGSTLIKRGHYCFGCAQKLDKMYCDHMKDAMGFKTKEKYDAIKDIRTNSQEGLADEVHVTA